MTKKKWRENTNQSSEKRIQGIFSGPMKRNKYGQPKGSFTVVSAKNLPWCPGRKEGSGWHDRQSLTPLKAKLAESERRALKL